MLMLIVLLKQSAENITLDAAFGTSNSVWNPLLRARPYNLQRNLVLHFFSCP